MARFNYENVKEYKLFHYVRWIGTIVRNVNYKVEYTGLENIPDGGGYIIASNHITALDPLYIMLAFKKSLVHFMAKKELFKIPVVGWVIKHCCAFPVARGTGDKLALSFAGRIPQQGFILGIFPEGTRSKDGKIGKGKRGVTQVVAVAKCDVLPVSIYNEDGLKKRSRITVRFGKPIKYEQFGFDDEPTRQQQLDATELIMNTISQMWGEGHCK